MSAGPSAAPLVEGRQLVKAYPGVTAVDHVDISIAAGEAVGLVGENGSGKSTLLRILAGRTSPGDGVVLVDGHPVTFRAPAEALRLGIALVAQEIFVQDDLSLAENLLEGRLPRRRLGMIDWRAARAEARTMLESAGLGHLAPETPARQLALHDQQMLAITKVVMRRPRLALFDEPTSSLTAAEVDRMYAMIRKLRADGCAIVYTSHRLHEYFDLTDRLIVLRDGNVVADEATAALDEGRLVQRMVGRKLERIFERPNRPAAPRPEPVLEVTRLTTKRLRGIDLSVGAGEIVGVAGQAGSGRSSLAGTLFGRWPYNGEITVNGRAVRLRSPADAIGHGLALVPEDRKRHGLVPAMPIWENLAMPSWSKTSRFGARSRSRDRDQARSLSNQFAVRAASIDLPVAALSGGNQQKVVIAKWASRDTKVLILDEPTRGVDVGAKAEIYGLIDELAEHGVAVLVLSSEMLEVMRLAHRIVVMGSGTIVGELNGDDATEEAIAQLAFANIGEGART